MKEFNTTALCVPTKHYMVDISERVAEIKKMIDAGKYFTINRARQYGKTTTLQAVRRFIEPEYVVLSLDFQMISASGFSSEEGFAQEFCRLILKNRRILADIPSQVIDEIEMFRDQQTPEKNLGKLFDLFSDWCDMSDKPIVLLIDEVDSATNNQVFLDFLAMLRADYIARDASGSPAFQSVILAGVTDIKHLKSKIREEADAKVNSPWNIAADYTLDMSLSEDGIRGMLDEYENDHHTGMDTATMAKAIREYTNGYPFLVSRICQLIDTTILPDMGEKAWTRDGLDEAIKMTLTEKNTLFDSLTSKLNNNLDIKHSLKRILMEGERIAWNSDQRELVLMGMYGFIRNESGAVKIDNRIFETRLYNLFLSDEDMENRTFSSEADLERNIFVKDGKLDVRLILERFIETYHQVCGPLEDKFKEKDGREQFLLYLRPIINGTGNYYIEAQTRDQRRTDVIIDYLGQQYIIELKIWRGERYNEEGERQISEYLDYFNLSTGYMLSFNFNKNKETGVKQVQVGDKVLYEATV